MPLAPARAAACLARRCAPLAVGDHFMLHTWTLWSSGNRLEGQSKPFEHSFSGRQGPLQLVEGSSLRAPI